MKNVMIGMHRPALWAVLALGLLLAIVMTVTATPAAASDAPTVSIADAGAQEGGVLEFTVSVSTPIREPIKMAWRVSGMEAQESDGDYPSGQSGHVKIKPRRTSTTVRISTTQDSKYEPDERISVRIFPRKGILPAGVVVGKDTAFGTIRNDDAQPRPEPVVVAAEPVVVAAEPVVVAAEPVVVAAEPVVVAAEPVVVAAEPVVVAAEPVVVAAEPVVVAAEPVVVAAEPVVVAAKPAAPAPKPVEVAIPSTLMLLNDDAVCEKHKYSVERLATAGSDEARFRGILATRGCTDPDGWLERYKKQQAALKTRAVRQAPPAVAVPSSCDLIRGLCHACLGSDGDVYSVSCGGTSCDIYAYDGSARGRTLFFGYYSRYTAWESRGKKGGGPMPSRADLATMDGYRYGESVGDVVIGTCTYDRATHAVTGCTAS